MVKYFGGGIIEGSSTLTTSPPATSWKELDRVTLGAAGADLDTGTFTAKDNIMILAHTLPSGTTACDLTFNADSGSNYASRQSGNGGADGTSTNNSLIDMRNNSNEEHFHVINVINNASQEKLGVSDHVGHNSSGAGNAPNRREMTFKWANTSNQINQVKFNKGAFTNFASGSEVVVLGCDNDEVDSGTNFWQELASVESTGDNHTTGTFAAKKYLWVQTNVVTTGGAVSQRMTFNDDTGSNYAARLSFDGGADSTQTNGSNINAGLNDDLVTNSIGIANIFIVNKSDKEKLGIIHTNSGEASGAGNAPTRDECVFKWTNTSSQITKIDFDNNKAGDWASGSFIKVWGAD